MSKILQESTQDDAIEVKIFDRTYRLRRTVDPDYLKKVAAIVDERMRQVHGADRTRPAGDLAVLAALQLAHELTEALSERSSKEDRFRKRTKELELSLDLKLQELGI